MSVTLSVENLSRSFGGIRAVDNVSFATQDGGIIGVIGPNGAGKTTLFNLISGAIRPDSGSVVFGGESLSGLSASTIARRGLVRTFQMTTVFAGHSIFDNLYRAAIFRQLPSPMSLFNPRGVARGRRQAALAAEQALEKIGMTSLADVDAASLAYGQQKILGVGMALTAQPRMLLMDEPAAGLNPSETVAMGDLIMRVHGSGIEVVLVEHDMQLVMRLCRHIVVLVNGRKLTAGPAAEVRSDSRVIEAYLGADLENA